MSTEPGKNVNIESQESEKILLVLLPFWDPQIPPLGIACLKSYLSKDGYEVKTADANLNLQFRELYDRYFNILRKTIPENKQGNIFNIGNQVLRNHMMAHLNQGDETKYIELVKILVRKTFFTSIDEDQIIELNSILKEFYLRLKKYVESLVEQENPTVFGLSVYGDTFAASMAAFRWIKEKNPGIKTVMGGGIFADQMAPGSPNLEYLIDFSREFIDKIIIGEGEELMVQFLRGELENSRRVFGIKDTAGKNVDLSTVDVPDFDDFDLSFYPHLAHYGGRSCPYQCKFCSETINWGKYRKKDISQTVREFNLLYQRHQYPLFLMTDSTLNPIINELSEEFIKTNVSIYWDGFLRADRHVCNTENTLLWRRGGFYRAKLGLESGSQRVLDLMDKRITVEQSQMALASLAFAGIKTTTFWLFGFPGESEDDFQQTLNFLEQCKDNIYEADCNAFNYYLTGQANSEEWQKNNKGILLYPSWAKEMLVTQTWVLDCEPSREVSYDRLNRFIAHCKRLEIPNPYSLNDAYKADERWKRLHKNAVPPIVQLKDKGIDKNDLQKVKEFSFAQNKLEDKDDWF